MADDETTTKKRPARDSEDAKPQTRKTGDSGESQRPAAKRPAPKRTPSAERSSPSAKPSSGSASGSASKSGESPEGAQEDPQESSPSKSSVKSGGEDPGKSAGGLAASDGGGSGRKMNTAKAARGAMDQLQDLTNRDAEGIVGIEKDDDGGGWVVTIEVVEGRRIPSTADVLAEYSVTVDAEGDLTAYSRLSRYVRGRASRGE